MPPAGEREARARGGLGERATREDEKSAAHVSGGWLGDTVLNSDFGSDAL